MAYPGHEIYYNELIWFTNFRLIKMSFPGALAEWGKRLSAPSYLSDLLSVHPHRTTRLQLDGLS